MNLAKLKKQRNKLYILFAIIFMLFASFCVYKLSAPSDGKMTDAIKFKNEYESLNNKIRENSDKKIRSIDIPKDNPFVYAEASDVIKMINQEESFIVYFGFPDCPWCQAYVGILNNVAKKEKIEKIYYFDIYEAREKNTKEYKKIVSILKKYLKSDEEGNPRVYVPDVYVVVDGKIINHNNETSVVEEDILPVSYWTDERIKELEKTLTKNFEPLKAKVCTHCN